jgi:hypothetical protein
MSRLCLPAELIRIGGDPKLVPKCSGGIPRGRSGCSSGALIGTAVWLIARRRDRRGDPLDRAREVPAERHARGEFSGEEYRQRLDELTHSFQGATLDG